MEADLQNILPHALQRRTLCVPNRNAYRLSVPLSWRKASGCPTNDSLWSPRHFLSPKFVLISEIFGQRVQRIFQQPQAISLRTGLLVKRRRYDSNRESATGTKRCGRIMRHSEVITVETRRLHSLTCWITPFTTTGFDSTACIISINPGPRLQPVRCSDAEYSLAVRYFGDGVRFIRNRPVG